MRKEGSANVKFFVSILVLSLLMILAAVAVNIDLIKPGNNEINTTATRSLNFTFNATWFATDAGLHAGSNCTIWTNYTGNWVETAFNHTNMSVINQSISGINVTFNDDIGVMAWSVGCYNESPTSDIAVLNFTSNRTLAIDSKFPRVVQTADIFAGFNTSDATPTLTINLTDTRGTGINLTTNGDNATLNISILDVSSGADALLESYNLSNGSLSCTQTGDSVQNTQCTIDLSTLPLSNGTKNITVQVTDRGRHTNQSSFMFTLDNVPPKFFYYNFTDHHNNFSETNPGGINLSNATELGVGDGVSTAQGRTIWAVANWTDNMTQVSQALFQFYNGTTASWQTLDINMTGNTSVTKYRPVNNGTWTNFTFTIPQGRSKDFEGRNVSFRIIANDTSGNINNSLIAKNFTIQVNDTYVPNITINGTLAVNGRNLSSTTIPVVSWAVEENNQLVEINISIDSNTNNDNGCNLYRSYKATSGVNDPNANRNNSFATNPNGDAACNLGNGTHTLVVHAKDVWGNIGRISHSFNVQSGGGPGLFFNLTKTNSTGQGFGVWPKSAINGTNITSSTGITLYGINGLGSSVNRIVYTSSCDSTSVTVENETIIFPFNGSCLTTAANQTLTVTVNDTAGNSNTTVLGFLVDNVGPLIAVSSPTNGQTVNNLNITLNVSALDTTSQVYTISYYLDEDGILRDTNDSKGLVANLSILGGSPGENTSDIARRVNLTGTHTIKFTVNDTLGNVRNSSIITFTQIGALDIAGPTGRNVTVRDNIGANNISNVTFKNASGALIETEANIGQTLELFLALNGTSVKGRYVNVTINFNGSAVDWNKTPEIYISTASPTNKSEIQLANNHTADIINFLYVNESLSRFLTGNNSYYGKVSFVMNASSVDTDNGSIGGKVELWYFPDENDMNTKTNITQCSATLSLSHSLTSGLPCWNNTNNRSVDIYVPHFSIIAFTNNTQAPTINISTPISNQTVSMFIPAINVSADTVTCKYHINDTAPANKTMIKTGNNCIGETERLKNSNTSVGVYNITYWVVDDDLNANRYIFNFTVGDDAAPNEPNSSRVSTSVGSTSATITVSGMNESVNVTVLYGTSVGSLSSSSTQTDFNESQAVSLSSLSASTTYHFNVSVCDFNGNCNVNGTFNLTTDAAASSSSSSSSSSGSSGGGGGAAATTSVTDSKAQVWSSVPVGSSFSLDVDKAGIAVTSVGVEDTTAELTNVELSVAALSDNPVADAPSAKVFQYLRITKKNIPDASVGSYKVGFRVEKAWLTDNSLGSGDVALYRFTDSKWNELTTRVTGTDATYVNYEADTPGFSSFAIASKSGAAAAEETPAEEAEEAPAAEEGAPEEVEKPVPVQAPGKAPIAWIIAGIVIVVGIVLIVIYQKSRK